jgi:type IV pilus assembly protein PilB
LLEKGKITAQQLEIAQNHSQEFGVRIGQSLIELGFAREADVADAMRNQAHLPCIRLTSGIVDPKVAAKLGASASRRLRALAVNRVAEYVTVALEDPESFKIVDELANLLECNVFAVYAEPSVIRKVTAEVFAHGDPGATAPATAGESAANKATAQTATWVETGDGAPDQKLVVERVRGLLQDAFARGVSDIHLEPGRDNLRVRLRLHGSLLEHGTMPIAWAAPTIRCLRALAGLGESETSARREGTIPFLFKKQRVEVRVLTTPSMHGESAVLHVLGAERRRRKVAELGFTAGQRASLDAILEERGGLLLVTGPAASGKITTLHALLEHLVRADRKVIALEERNQQALEGVLQVEIDPEMGAAGSLHALMNQDPDVLLLGVIDGAETARAVLEAARFGCFVLAGIQAPTATAAITRFVKLGLEPYLVAETLLGVVAQRLARKICPECKAPTEPDPALLRRIGLTEDGTSWSEGKGCNNCRNTGARGRVPLFEVVPTSADLWQRIEQGANTEALEEARESGGHTSMRDHALDLARAGVIGLREVLAAIRS